MIDCIIFDMDGTLVDSERLMMRGLMEMVPQITHSHEAMVHRFGGQHLKKTFAIIEKEFGLMLPDDFEPNYRAHVATLIRSELKAFEGVEEVLMALEIPFCLATNAPMEKTELVMRTTGLDRYFETRLFSAYEVGAWKPDPGLFLHAAETMQVSPKNCLVVEDSAFGVEAGLAAGMHVLQFCSNGEDPVHHNHFHHYSNFHEAVEAGLRAATNSQRNI